MHNFREKPDLTPEVEARFAELIEFFLNNVYMLQYHPERYQAEKERREAEERQREAEKAIEAKKHKKEH